MNSSPELKSQIAELMKSYGFTGETRFYRYSLPKFLETIQEAGAYRISANPDPSEAVIDEYAGGHICLAKQIGPGLAFTKSADNEWKESGRTGVEVRLQDVLDQGGRIYPVESVVTDRVWYFTLPEGSVRVSVIAT